MKIVNNILFIEFEEATQSGISTSTIRKANHYNRSCWKFIKDPTDNRKLLIEYEALKPKYKELVINQYGDPYQYLSNQILEPYLIIKELDQKFVDDYTRANGTHLETSIADRIKDELKYLSLLSSINPKTARSLGFKSIKEDLYKAIVTQIQAKNLKLPKSYRKLRARVNRYKEEGAACQFGRINNVNRQRLTDKHTDLLIAIAGDEQARQLTYVQIYDAFIAKCNELGWQEMLEPEQIHFQALYKHMKTNENKFFLQRNGYNYWLNNKELVINMEKASGPNVHWQLDGTPEALWFYDEPRRIIDKVYVFKVIDSYSWKVVGYAVSTTETSQVVMNSVKNACVTNGVKPHQFLYDKGSALLSGDTQQMLSSLSKHHFAAATGRARAKTIEPWQAHMNRTIYSWYENNSGGNLTAKSLRSRANEDYIKKHRKQFPSKQELIGQIHFAFSLWNNMAMGDGRTPNEKYNDSSKHKKLELSFEDQVNNFWVFRSRGKKKQRLISYPFTNQGIEVNYGKNNVVRYIPQFDTPEELAMFMNMYVGVARFFIKYDPTDLEQIGLYHLPQGKEEIAANMQLVTFASTKQKTKQAIADFEEGDAELLAFYRNAQKEQRKLVEEEMDGRRKRLEAENILHGAIPMGEVYKDAHNAAKIDLQRMQQMGYANNITIDDQQRMQAEPDYDEYAAEGDIVETIKVSNEGKKAADEYGG